MKDNRIYLNVFFFAVIICFFIIPAYSYATVSDTEGPRITSVEIDKADVTVGDTITFSVKATDESGVSTQSPYPYISLEPPGSGNYESVRLTETGNGIYTGTYEITSSTINGDYKITRINFVDTYGNFNYCDDYNGVAFSVIDKDLYNETHYIDILDKITVINSDKTIVNSEIVGDLIIAPNTIASLNNVIVAGNIYVLGTLRANLISANTIYSKHLTMGSLAYGNGAVSLSGNCTVSSTITKVPVINEVPLRIDSNLISVDGKLSIKGAYAKIADMYVNDIPVNSTNSGKFYLNDINLGNAESITIKFVTAEKETFSKKYDVVKGVIGNDGNPNGIPEIQADDLSVCEGTELDLLNGVKANDYEDGDISDSVVASPLAISTSEPEVHTVIYSVTDSKGTKVTKTVSVEIKSHEWDDGITTKEATCTETGQKKYVCGNCLKERTETIPAKGHKWNEKYTTDKAPTCTEEGSESIHCSLCDAKKDSRKIDATGHTYDQEKVDDKYLKREADCTHAAVYYKSCKCGESSKGAGDKEATFESGKALGHDYQEVEGSAAAPTCTKDRKEADQKCSPVRTSRQARKSMRQATHGIMDLLQRKQPVIKMV